MTVVSRQRSDAPLTPAQLELMMRLCLGERGYRQWVAVRDRRRRRERLTVAAVVTVSVGATVAILGRAGGLW